MIVYVLKVITCSAIFLGFYYVFLQKEKMYSFNRYYLLFSLFTIFILPIIKIGHVEALENPISETLYPVYTSISQFETLEAIVPQESTRTSSNIYFLIIYAIICGGLLIRFIVLTWLLYAKAQKHKAVNFASSKLVLIDDDIAPHSFFNYIFINKKDYKNLSEEILIHELEHVQNKHTIDVVLIELLIIFFWFNPFLYLYRQVIKLNHEFLADNAVLNHFNDIKSYQSLLLRYFKKVQLHSFVSQLNFPNTKIRFIMMTRSRSTKRNITKQIALIPIFLIVVFFISEKTIAQKEVVQDKKEIAQKNTSAQASQSKQKDDDKGEFSFYAPASSEGATEQQMLEYASIVDKYKSSEAKSWWKDFKKDISKEDRDRLESIFLQMNRDQQKQQSVAFIKAMGTLPKKVPTTEQIESWKDAKMYGVWIDDKRVDNFILDNHQATDFSHLFVSKLAKNAKNYGKHYYQVNLMTNRHFQEFNKKQEANKGTYRMVFHLGKSYTL